MTASNVKEILKRKGVWTALSEFYLDTELQASDFERIASTFVQSGYSIKEIKLIDLYEVFPLLQANLLSVAGEWAGFDENLLYEGCEKNYLRRDDKVHKIRCLLLNKVYFWMRKKYWTEVEKIHRQSQ